MIIIGNIISFIANIFTLLSGITNNRKMVFAFQFIHCTLLSLASFFLNSYSGVTILLICALRNGITALDIFSKNMMYLFSALTVIIGIISNNRGFIGLLPVIATLIFTISIYYSKTIVSVKLNLFFNGVLWVIYSLFIQDYPTALSDGTLSIIVIISLIKYCYDTSFDFKNWFKGLIYKNNNN